MDPVLDMVNKEVMVKAPMDHLTREEWEEWEWEEVMVHLMEEWEE